MLCIRGRQGLDLDLVALPRTPDVATDAAAPFAESGGRFLMEVAPGDAAAFEAELTGCPLACLGRVADDGVLRVRGLEECSVIECPVGDLLRAWQSAAPWACSSPRLG